MPAALYFADKDDMIAFLVAAAIEALKGRRSAFNQGCATGTSFKPYASESVSLSRGKLLREVLLVGAQNVDGVMRPRTECCHGTSRAGQTP